MPRRTPLVALFASILCLSAGNARAIPDPARADSQRKSFESRSERLPVTALRVEALTSSTSASLPDADFDADDDETAAERTASTGSTVAPFSVVAPGLVSPDRDTPAPSLRFDSLGGTNDPQIAVSKHFVVVTSYNNIEVYDKQGHKLGGKNGHAFANPFSTSSFYRPLWNPSSANNINTALKLPASLKCNAHLDYTNPANAAATKFCLNDYYDTRVVYDFYRQRFWIVSLARNTNARTNPDGSSITDPNILRGRRSFVTAAVSRTEDPRDGFYETFWAAAVDEGACNTPADVQCPGTYFHPGDAGDYPMIAITDRYLIESHNVSNVISKNSRYASVRMLLADQMTQGQIPASWVVFNIDDYDGNIITGGIVPAFPMTNPGYTAFALERSDSLVVLGIVSDAGGAPLYVVRSAVFLGRDFVTVRDPALPGTSSKMLMSNIRGIITGLVFRQGYLYASIHDCVSFNGGACSDGVRLIRVNASTLHDFEELPNDAADGFFDITFGLRAADDPVNAVVDFGLPNLMLTKNGDMVIVYVRAGKTVFPEVRYSILYAAETLPRSPVLLRKGSFAATGNIDTGGIALDPSDDRSIWMAHDFGDSKVRSDTVAVGKVTP